MRRANRWRRVGTVLASSAAVVVLLAACTTVTNGSPTLPRSRTSASAHGPAAPSTSSATPSPASCPASYVAPDPTRPKVALAFTFSDDLTTVRGTEHVVFTPDKPITELVFRLTANTIPTVAAGNKIVVGKARADHGAGPSTFTSSGADPSTQGGLLHIPFAQQIPAGTTVTADIAFTITVGGAQSFDRFGRSGDGDQRYSWIGSGQPLLAWERGFGWHDEELIRFTAESATSEAMDTTLTVTAPSKDTVIMSGDPADPPVSAARDRVWSSHLAAARDVSVSVGPFAVSDTVVHGVHLRVGAYTPGLRDSLVPEFQRAITNLEARFGPFPFPSLSVARLPAQGGGIEYPASILMLNGSRLVAVHETAHQWFYAMVGDSQALHPWLDEAFAVYAQHLVDGESERPGTLHEPGTVDKATASYGDEVNTYFFVTYDKGAAALEEARAVAGAPQWDEAMRCYIRANAWRIANPSDLRAVMAQFPKSIAVLTQAGALP
ncbi:MAG: peptidase M1 [Actinomycetota bacterium]|nr:peptidase M1 [Actinomycetota bacterium]